MVFDVQDFQVECWLNHPGEKPLIMSSRWIEEFLTKLSELDRTKPLFLFAPSGIAGADIKEMATMSSEQAKAFSFLGSQLTLCLYSYKPLVIGLFDRCVIGGGLELALACDIIAATQSCRIGFPEVTLGIAPGFLGIDLSIVKKIPLVMELVYTGKIFTCKELSNRNYFNQIENDWESILLYYIEIKNNLKKVSNFAVSIAKEYYLRWKLISDSECSDMFFSLFNRKEVRDRFNAFLGRSR